MTDKNFEIDNDVKVPESESYNPKLGFWEDEGKLKDRLGGYLQFAVKERMLFDNLSDDYLKRAGLLDVLKGVAIPVDKKNLSEFSTVTIGQNMAVVIGGDINFKYRDNYIAFIRRLFGKDFAKPLINEGIELAGKGDFVTAMIYFRASLLIDERQVDGLYCYGRALKDMYESQDAMEDAQFVGALKGEALEVFEKLTLWKPDFDMGYYYLGYAYMNLGLYLKAKLTFEDFQKYSKDKSMREEIAGWLLKLKEPIKIEGGYNLILRGQFQEGLDVLLPYSKDKRFEKWWPLWFYMAVAYRNLDRPDDAVSALKELLRLSPSNEAAMKELIDIYKERGDLTMAEKYENKLAIVRKNAELDRLQRNDEEGIKLS